jgi:hypothetical protein
LEDYRAELKKSEELEEKMKKLKETVQEVKTEFVVDSSKAPPPPPPPPPSTNFTDKEKRFSTPKTGTVQSNGNSGSEKGNLAHSIANTQLKPVDHTRPSAFPEKKERTLFDIIQDKRKDLALDLSGSDNDSDDSFGSD